MEKRSRKRGPFGAAVVWLALMAGDAAPALGQNTVVGRLAPGSGESPSPAAELTLEEAVTNAFARSPEIRAAEARLGEAQGRVAVAHTYPHNPVLGGEVGWRRGPDRTSTDYGFFVDQEIEIAGQRGKRIAAAEAERAAERASVRRAQRLLAARVHLAFVTALGAQELLEVARGDGELAGRLYDLARRRLARGAGTQLDVNVAAAELGRTEARLASTETRDREARAALAEVIGLDPASLPLPRGDLHVPLEALPSLSEATAAALENRADLQALRDLEEASRVRLDLARSEGWPNLTLGAFVRREEGIDTIVGAGFSIPVPLFNRNQGRVAEREAGIDRSRAERETAELAVSRQVVAAHSRFETGRRTAERLRQLVLGTLEQSLELLEKSFAAGKASWPEVVVIRRSLVEAQSDLTVAEAAARQAWIELQLAAGRMPVPAWAALPEEER
jgi:cobalt-zinc-cadmium efflux system outer membrane protein